MEMNLLQLQLQITSFQEILQKDCQPHLQGRSGSVGAVYKGKLLDDQEVAIKRRPTGQLRKLSVLSTLHHKNLVRLIGYYEAGDEKI
ncbi:conserved hypothetical protein [Ricinus communis]|uniref:Protein kinase domain-containing protein n=1 Tax=Ricinus communis TaxID=3988 RepID=B9T566_RICCO|nr:conserved hypothetical protein [Ricinus communis]